MLHRVILSCLMWIVTVCGVAASELSQPKKPNILVLLVDDLNDWVEPLAGHPQAQTPAMSQLAAQSTVFTNAHCQAPICNPSRTSFMLGMRPSSTGIYQNSPWFRSVAQLKDEVTLAQWYRTHGYETLAAGKVFHASRPDAMSFEVQGPRPGQRLSRDERIQKDLKGLWDFGSQNYDAAEFQDAVTTDWALGQLEIRAAKPERPWLMMLGYYRPHVPLYAPRAVFKKFPRESVVLPSFFDRDRDDLPAAAIALTANPTPPPHSWFEQEQRWQSAVQAYLACVTFTDSQIGRVHRFLQDSGLEDNTIVVLLSDHGFHLGEKQRWAKQSLWERSTRVPLMIRLPGQKTGRRSAAPVELLSVFPTLTELTGLPVPSAVEGNSLVPLLADPDADWPYAAITTYGPSNHAVRTRHLRYIRYADGSEELYDHRNDSNEWTNLAERENRSADIARLRRFLPATNAADRTPKKRRQPAAARG